MNKQQALPVGFAQAFDAMCEAQFNQADKKGASATPSPTILKLSGRLRDPLHSLIERVARMRKDGEQCVEMVSDDAVETLNGLIAEARDLMKIESPFPSFGYFINLNERGYFEADVRDIAGKTVFEIKSGLSLPRGESDLFDDGFMKHAHDLGGLEKHLKDINVIPAEGKLFGRQAFEEMT